MYSIPQKKPYLFCHIVLACGGSAFCGSPFLLQHCEQNSNSLSLFHASMKLNQMQIPVIDKQTSVSGSGVGEPQRNQLFWGKNFCCQSNVYKTLWFLTFSQLCQLIHNTIIESNKIKLKNMCKPSFCSFFSSKFYLYWGKNFRQSTPIVSGSVSLDFCTS